MEVRRKLVPHQKASTVVVPFKSVAIVGIATDRIVASYKNLRVSLMIETSCGS